MKKRDLLIAVDLHGCPNRCRHCWLGHAPNPSLTAEELRFAAAAFRTFARELEIDSWYREPDYRDDYRELWALEQELSTRHAPHFELCSFWRLARDAEYAPWLYAQGVREMQLTLFGGEAMTDRYIGRAGAYQELLLGVDRLMAAGIAPRLQVFVNGETLPELPQIERLIADWQLDERCQQLGREFHFFLHTGSCDGANRRHYDCWLTPEDLDAIPQGLLRRAMTYFGVQTAEEIFGQPENALLRQHVADDGTLDLARANPNAVNGALVLFVDGKLDVYPNYTAPSPAWRLGNLRTDGAERILQAFDENASPAQRALATVPASTLVRFGNAESRRLFRWGDLRTLLLARYLESEETVQ